MALLSLPGRSPPSGACHERVHEPLHCVLNESDLNVCWLVRNSPSVPNHSLSGSVGLIVGSRNVISTLVLLGGVVTVRPGGLSRWLLEAVTVYVPEATVSEYWPVAFVKLLADEG